VCVRESAPRTRIKTKRIERIARSRRYIRMKFRNLKKNAKLFRTTSFVVSSAERYARVNRFARNVTRSQFGRPNVSVVLNACGLVVLEYRFRTRNVFENTIPVPGELFKIFRYRTTA